MVSRRSTIQVAFEASHDHSSARDRMLRPSCRSRLLRPRASLGVSPRCPRICVRCGAVRIKRSNINRHTRRASRLVLREELAMCRSIRDCGRHFKPLNILYYSIVTPTVWSYVTSVVVDTYECDDGRVGPT